MLAPRCTRCNDPFEPRHANDRRCVRCEVEIARLVEEDTRRRTTVRFLRARDMRGVAA